MTYKILIVDDDPDLCKLLKLKLESSLFEIRIARNGLEGLQGAYEYQPDLIILDVMMPNEAGLQLYRDLKEDNRLKRIPVIMVSSVGKKTFLQYQKSYCTLPEADSSAPVAYLKKPLNAEELVGWVHALTAPAPAA